VRKIISILIALGLVLGLSAIATPVGAVTAPVVTVTPNCACATANYTIAFNTSASLTEGVTHVCIVFPAGTTVPTSFADGAITIDSNSVFGSEVTVTGQKVCFLVPANLGSGPHTVVITGIGNPCTPGPYTLTVNTDRAPDATPVASAPYTIAPAISVYGFVWDSNPTYPGIAVGFVPPMRAGGQPGYGTNVSGVWYHAFNFTLMATTVGCAAPCAANVTMNVTLAAAPAGSTVTLNLTGTPTWGGTLTPAAPSSVISTSIPLGTNTTIVWTGLINFDTVGQYQICFDVICPAGALVCPVCSSSPVSVVHQCFNFNVYQWKDAAKITLREKWNLISLPLVPLVGASAKIEDLLASIPAAAQANIISIWNYDRCTDKWASWGAGQTGLTTLQDGKAYWVRVAYPLAGCGNISWWVWGTVKPMPPASPAAYPVCAGWNMVGFLGTSPLASASYLWNWATQPVIYSWTQGCWTSQGWSLVGAGNLNPGQGYWMAFPAAGAVYVP